jgi:5-methylcytosine-specific restriction endonuclease McrA
MDILHTPHILRLNGNYMRLGWSTPVEAFCMLMGESKDGSPPALALDIHYEYDSFGMPITDKMESFDRLDWEYWMILEPRKGDLDKVIHTSKRIIRIPTVIICPKFSIMPLKDQKPTPRAIRKRDGNRCQYTGVELTHKTFSIDHVVPKSQWRKMGRQGSPDTWENLVAAHKEFNSKKGNQFNHEIGAKLLKKPVAPKQIPICALHTESYHPDHSHF